MDKPSLSCCALFLFLTWGLPTQHTSPGLGGSSPPAFTPAFTPASTTASTTASVPSAWMADQLRTCYPHLFPRQC